MESAINEVLAEKDEDIPDEKIVEAAEIFNVFCDKFVAKMKDRRVSGEHGENVVTAMRCLGLNPTPKEVASIRQCVHEVGGGKLDFDMFCNLYELLHRDKTKDYEVERAFRKVLDRKEEKSINPDDLRKQLQSIKPHVEDVEIEAIIRQAIGTSETLIINYESFMNTMLFV